MPLPRPTHAPSGNKLFRLLPLTLLFAGFTALALAFPPAGARAAGTTWHVAPGASNPCSPTEPNCNSIQAAVNAAAPGDTIEVAAGTYIERVNISKNLTINGAGSGVTFVDGLGQAPVINITAGEVKISGLTITGGRAAPGGGGGGVSIASGNVTLSWCSINGNAAPPNFDDFGGFGGGVLNGTGTLTLEWCRVTHNSAGRGAGISSSGPLVITNSTVESNTAEFRAGGILYTAGLTMRDSAVLNNRSVNDRGGGLNGSGETSLVNSTVSGNTAALGGGGGTLAGPVVISRSLISDNKLVSNRGTGDNAFGAGISTGALTIADSVVSGNDGNGNTGSRGGGIAADSLTMTNCLVTENRAVSEGGGIYNRGAMTISNSVVSNNVIVFNGGGIANFGTATISDSSVVNNSGIQTGAGIINTLNATLTLNNTTVSNNADAFSGGGVGNLGTLRVNNSTFFNDTARSGGAVFNSGTLSVSNSTFGGNRASSGGAVNNQGTADILNSTLSGNEASNAGGAVFNSANAAAPVRLKNSIVAGNVAPAGPDLAGAFTSQGHNLVGSNADATGLTNGVGGDIVGTSASPADPKLFPLGNYGGATQTFALRPGSPALDAGDDSVTAGPAPLTADQRGLARKTGPHVDIGSVESDGTDSEANLFQFGAAAYTVAERGGQVTVTVRRRGPAGAAASVEFATADNGPDAFPPCGTAGGNASSRCDYEAAFGTLRFAAGEDSKTFTVAVNDDAFLEGKETARLTLSNPTGGALGPQSTATLEIADDQTEAGGNTLDDAQNFVRQQYHDFLNREPDTPGFLHWSREILSCGSNAACAEVKRINVSGAFFLSIEFNETGYLVYKTYGAAFGTKRGGGTVPLTIREFTPDTRAIGEGVVVNLGRWRSQLEANKQAYFDEFVTRPAFTALYPATMPAAEFVDALNANTGGSLTQTERDSLVARLGAGQTGRGQALREVAENAAFSEKEKNRAFVLMQYFGYLRRNPNEGQDTDFSGYNHWLANLEKFNGNFVQAELVKAFISSIEYRQRFGQ